MRSKLYQDATRVGGLTAEFFHSVKEGPIPAILRLFNSVKRELTLPSSLYEATTVIALLSTVKPYFTETNTG